MHASRLNVLAFTLLLAGCATANNPRDPLEGYNRAMFTFNDKADQFVLKPVATAYHNVLPSFIQTGVGNFFGNLGDVWTGVNNVLEGKVHNGMSDFARFGVNTTIGIAGLFDVGSKIGLVKHNRDFGETLGGWGVKSGPYVVLPLLGPSTLRDTVALPVDLAGNLWSYKYPVRQRNEGTILYYVDLRATTLDASKLLEEAALDRYEFVRDGYLQRRESKVRDDDQVNPKQRDAPRSNLQDTPGGDGGAKKPTDATEATEPGKSAEMPAPSAQSTEDGK